MNYYAIIVAGGSGNRMNNSIPKQFLLLNGKPVLMHSIEVFYNCPQKPEIIVVLGHDLHQTWNTLCGEFDFQIPHTLVNSGAERFHSVKNALSSINVDGIVAIHDAARPLVSAEVVNTSYNVALEKGNSVVGILPVDSVRQIASDGSSRALDRSELRLVQTPQTFKLADLQAAYNVAYRPEFTDDASVVEYYGVNINVIDGNRENIKITYPNDLEIASVLMYRKRP
jgi:2-C-methyl-D-erythritol 4-phosphate cytidylyltransferase